MIVDFIEYSKQPPPSNGRYLVAIYYQNGKKLMEFVKFDGKQFEKYNNVISHWSFEPVHPVRNEADQRRRDWAKKIYDTYNKSYDVEMIRNFCRYWGELKTNGPNNGKMKWELQKTFEPKLRLATWKRNNDKMNPENATTTPSRPRI